MTCPNPSAKASDITFEKLRIALDAVGRWVAERSPGGLVVVGHDTRAEGERMAELAAAVLRGHGLKPLLASGSVPTPVVAWAVRRRAAAAGVVFTASHNPPEYHGMKVLTDSGGGVDAEQARRIEALAADGADESVAVPGGAPRVELCADYRRDLLRQLDPRAFEGASLAVVYDAMHGAGAGVLDTLLESLGVRVTRRRAEPDPTFGVWLA